MRQKRILFLGGAYAQIPVIAEARRRNWYIITCDYLPNNPGHKLADEYHNISTTDYDGVLKLAQKVKPNFVIAYASDPAAPVAAYVSEKLGLPGNSYESVRLLSEKDLFRTFLRKNGFKAPRSISILPQENIYEKTASLTYPFIIKPIDSSGSKGVVKVESESKLAEATNHAFSFSRIKRVIAEEYIESEGPQLHGDGFVIDGELVFSYLGDHHYNESVNPFVPFSTTWPSIKDSDTIAQVESEFKRAVKLSGYMNGPVNLEARITNNGDIFIMEIGPRSGGNFVPQVINNAIGFNMVKAILDQLIGKQVIIPDMSAEKASAYYAIHSDKEGILTKLKIHESLLPYVKEFHQYIKPGEKVKAFHGANAAIGLILLTFPNKKVMAYSIVKMTSYIVLNIY